MLARDAFTENLVLTAPRCVNTINLASPANPPAGCNFNTRCPVVFDLCYQEPDPPLIEVRPNHFVSCHRVT